MDTVCKPESDANKINKNPFIHKDYPLQLATICHYSFSGFTCSFTDSGYQLNAKLNNMSEPPARAPRGAKRPPAGVV
jgi:hypothetical protein